MKNLNSNFLHPLDKFDIAETKEIVLGNLVDSIASTTRSGEKITFDNTFDFYEILNKIGSFTQFEKGKKYSYIAEIKLENQNNFLMNANVYYNDNDQFYEFRVKKEGADPLAVIEQYYHQKPYGKGYITDMFVKTICEDDKAFGGVEYGENGQEVYKSDSYPMTPQVDSELSEMSTAAHNLLNFLSYMELFDNDEIYKMFRFIL